MFFSKPHRDVVSESLLAIVGHSSTMLALASICRWMSGEATPVKLFISLSHSYIWSVWSFCFLRTVAVCSCGHWELRLNVEALCFLLLANKALLLGTCQARRLSCKCILLRHWHMLCAVMMTFVLKDNLLTIHNTVLLTSIKYNATLARSTTKEGLFWLLRRCSYDTLGLMTVSMSCLAY